MICVNDTIQIDTRRFHSGKPGDEGITLSKTQWQYLKASADHMDFQKRRKFTKEILKKFNLKKDERTMKRKNVNFSDKTMVILIPYEERKGE